MIRAAALVAAIGFAVVCCTLAVQLIVEALPVGVAL